MRYTLTELGQGLRRNLSMHLAVVLTLFVSLTLVGLGVLLNQQAQKASDYWGGELQITFWLCKARDTDPARAGEVTDAQKQAIVKVVEDNPEVAGYRFETKEEAYQKLKEVFASDELEGSGSGPPVITAEDMPESLWIELKDPEQFEGIISAVTGLDGVSGHRDARATLKAIYSTMQSLQCSVSRPRCSWWSLPCCLSRTRSALPRSHDGGRSASCGWSEHRRSTSPCPSCSRPS